MMTLLCSLVVTLPVGTNLGLLHLLWMLVSGQLRGARGAVIPGLSACGLSDWAVRHRAIDDCRRRHDGRWADVAALTEVSDGTDTHDLACQHAEVRRVRTALVRLPAAQRPSLALAYAAGYTHPQIARAQGVPLGTVKGRLRLGLRTLRAHLGGHDGAAA